MLETVLRMTPCSNEYLHDKSTEVDDNENTFLVSAATNVAAATNGLTRRLVRGYREWFSEKQHHYPLTKVSGIRRNINT